MLVCIGDDATIAGAVAEAGHFAVSVLAENQDAVASRFADTGADRFAGTTISRGTTGLALIDGAVAHLECAIVARHRGGDHTIVVGEVLAADRGGRRAAADLPARRLPPATVNLYRRVRAGRRRGIELLDDPSVDPALVDAVAAGYRAQQRLVRRRKRSDGGTRPALLRRARPHDTADAARRRHGRRRHSRTRAARRADATACSSTRWASR